MGEGQGPGQHSILVFSSCVLSPPSPNIWSVFTFLGFRTGAVQGWCFVLWRAPGGALLHSEAAEKPEASGWEGFKEGAGVGWLGLCIPASAHAHSSFFVLSSVVPGCTHGRRRAETSRR